jgi:ATP-dependent protease ClpP protease subunit
VNAAGRIAKASVEQAVAYGLIDEVISTRISQEAPAAAAAS